MVRRVFFMENHMESVRIPIKHPGFRISFMPLPSYTIRRYSCNVQNFGPNQFFSLDFQTYNLPETNIAPENRWLDDRFLFGALYKRPIFRSTLPGCSFQGM